MENIKAVKLSTGEDIVAQVSITNDAYVLTNPVRLAVVPSQVGGQANFGFAPWPIYVEQKKGYSVEVHKSHVVFMTDPAEDFLQQYDQIFGSGIITPSKTLITG